MDSFTKLFKLIIEEISNKFNDLYKQAIYRAAPQIVYWLLPFGQIIPVQYAKHDQYIRDHLDQFGLSESEKDSPNFMLHTLALKNGAVRLGIDKRDNSGDIEVFSKDHLKKQAWNIYNFFKEHNVEVTYIHTRLHDIPVGRTYKIWIIRNL